MALACRSLSIVLTRRALPVLLSPLLALACDPNEVPPSPLRRQGEQPMFVADCYVAFSPVEALRLDTEEAATRWGLATGCDLFAADGGIPVVLMDSIERPDGSQAPGITSRWRDRIGINVRASERQRTSSVLHEMGHALGGDHVETDGVLWGQKGRRDVIDEAALLSVCSALDCPAFRPEEP